ncbi:mitochondrial ribosomal protein L28 [Carabus blaptoides fortunei]
MASARSQTAKVWNGWRAISIFEKEPGSLLPEAYRKFWHEWKLMTPTAVHYIPKESKWERNDVTGEVLPIQNVAVPVKYPYEHNLGIWGGEGIIKGFQKRSPYKRRVPHFWVPVLKRSVVYSEVLNKHISVIVTDRTIRLINDNYGFDHYLLKTPACDLKSLLALTLKRKVLLELNNKCPTYTADKMKQEEIYNQYKQYLSAYTAEDIEWYGYTFRQACEKFKKDQEALNTVQPLKHMYRSQLIEQLRTAGIKEAGETNSNEIEQIYNETSWIQKINPFGKKQET